MFHGKRRRKSNAKPSVSAFAPTTCHAVKAQVPLLNTHPNSSIYGFPSHHILQQPQYASPPPLPPRPLQDTNTIAPNTRLKDWKALPGTALSAGGSSWSNSNDYDYGHEVPEDSLADEALCNLISEKFDTVITSIDGEAFAGHEQELEIYQDSPSGIRGGWGVTSREVSRGANRAISTAVVSTNYFAKVDLYANSRLSPHLPPLKLYVAPVLMYTSLELMGRTPDTSRLTHCYVLPHSIRYEPTSSLPATKERTSSTQTGEWEQKPW